MPAPDVAADDAPPTSEPGGDLTARDLIAALRAVSHGAEPGAVLGDIGWERLVGALLSVLLRKQIVADWELIEELKRF